MIGFYVCRVTLKWLVKLAGIDAFPYDHNQEVYVTINPNILPYPTRPSTTLPRILSSSLCCNHTLIIFQLFSIGVYYRSRTLWDSFIHLFIR